MRWWLQQIPPSAGALVVENSAVSPELQSFAPDHICPGLVIWTTLRPDHAEAWGNGIEGAARALLRGVPRGVPVAGGVELDAPFVREKMAVNGSALHIPTVLSSGLELSHKEENLALAKTAIDLTAEAFNLSPSAVERAKRAMSALPPDLADFRVIKDGEDKLAAAFKANDLKSTIRLFAETKWTPDETTLLYHHRPDRPARLKDFLPWINSLPWKEKVFTREKKPWFSVEFLAGSSVKWNEDVASPETFHAWRRGRGRVFACGNAAGWPIELLKNARE
jgi:hypothetical protein